MLQKVAFYDRMYLIKENYSMQLNLSSKDVNNISPLALAFVGDAVFSLRVREALVTRHQVSEAKLTKLTSSVVNAGRQCQIFRLWQPMLTEEEADVARRARNSHMHTKAKNYSVEEYVYATALEAVVGYLHLTGQNERLDELMKYVVEGL